MPEYGTNGASDPLAGYETPFGDSLLNKVFEHVDEPISERQSFFDNLESPFMSTYETNHVSNGASPIAADYVQMLAELNDPDFSNSLYELAAELEDTWQSKITDELGMGERFLPFATRQADSYFSRLIRETDDMIDRVGEHFSDDNPGVYSESEIEHFFNEMGFDHGDLSPAQEQFFGSIFKKVKSVVKNGVNLAKKGIKLVGKLLPIKFILRKLKRLIKPLLQRVLKYAIGKLPKYLQPYAVNLSKKFLNLEIPAKSTDDNLSNEIPATADIDSIQTELDFEISQLLFSGEEDYTENETSRYENVEDNFQREMNAVTGGMEFPPIDVARQRFIKELKDLKPGEDPAPAIEHFLPAIYALKPAIKIGISLIGRPRIINFLANILSKLIVNYVPQNVAKPLASSIISAGLSAIGFETVEADEPELAYEAFANTIEETILNMDESDSDALDNQDVLASQLLESFEAAAANNFPSEYIREELRKTKENGLWILKPRKGPKHFYKKYSRVFPVTIAPRVAKAITIFKGNTLSDFLKDKLGLDLSKPIEARVHLYEAIDDTRLNRIARYEQVAGLGPRQPFGWVQMHPLTKEAATLLIREPALGKEISREYLRNRYKIAVGQRFYFLEINGAKLRIPFVNRSNHKHNAGAGAGYIMPGQSADIQGVINFVKSEIRLNYYFSEEEAKSMVEKLNSNDLPGIAKTIRAAVKIVLNNILIRNLSSKVKIIHEDFPELYLERYPDEQDQYALGDIKNAVRSIGLNPGKQLLTNLIEKLTAKLANHAGHAIVDHFKTRAAEFKQAQAEPKDGVTIKIDWINIPGMPAIRSLIGAVKGNFSIGNLKGLTLPEIPNPEIRIVAGKNFD